jgi:hypothetical protein
MSSSGEDRAGARIAARNNAEWCDIVCRTHGVPGRFDPDAWVSPRRTPPYYPDAVTLEPSADGERILERIDTTTPGCSIKDSFATLDLSPAGFQVVHEAEWIHRGPRPAPTTDDSGTIWAPLTTPAELVAWEAAWSGHGGPTDLFRAALLHDPSVMILGGVAGGSIVAGAVLNRTADVVGISDLFTVRGDLDGAWSGCLGYLEVASPGSAVVGYEAGDELAAAHRQGFESVGPLRVWLMP